MYELAYNDYENFTLSKLSNSISLRGMSIQYPPSTARQYRRKCRKKDLQASTKPRDSLLRKLLLLEGIFGDFWQVRARCFCDADAWNLSQGHPSLS